MGQPNDGSGLYESSRTETTVRNTDEEGKIVSETSTVIVYKIPRKEEAPTGMYL